MKKIILKKALLLFCMVCGNVAAYAIGGDGCYFVQTFEDLTTYPETKPDTETAFNVESQGEWLYLGAFQATNASYIPDGSEHNLRMTKNGSYVITPVVSNGISRVTFDIGRASVKVYTSADGGATWAEATQTVSGKKVTVTVDSETVNRIKIANDASKDADIDNLAVYAQTYETTVTVATGDATDITETTATLSGSITKQEEAIAEVGFVWSSTSKEPTLSDNVVAAPAVANDFSVSVTGLREGATVYYRAYAKYGDTQTYGPIKRFKTLVKDNGQTIDEEGRYFVQDFEDQSQYPANSSAVDAEYYVAGQGTWIYTKAGVSTNSSYTNGSTANLRMPKNGSYVITPILNSGVKRVTWIQTRQEVTAYTSTDGGDTWTAATITSNDKVRTVEVNGLNVNRIKLANDGGKDADIDDLTVYAQAFGTPATVATGSAINITKNTAEVSGQIIDAGDQPITEAGIIWRSVPSGAAVESAIPTLADNIVEVEDVNGLTEFSLLITGLKAEQTVCYRAYVLSNAGYAFGDVKSFTTAEATPAVVQTSDVTKSGKKYRLGGVVTDDGGMDLQEVGIVYGMESGLNYNNGTRVAMSKPSYKFSTSVALEEATTYYVRAYAITAKGTVYGEEKQFVTEDIPETPDNILGEEIWCSPDGDDATADGSQEHPFFDLQKAVDMAQPGDRIWMMAGTYVYDKRINIDDTNGEPDKMIELFGKDGQAVLDFSGMPYHAHSNNPYQGVRLTSSYWHFKNIDITNASDNGLLIERNKPTGGSASDIASRTQDGHDNIIELCNFYRNGDTGLQMKNLAANNKVINCDSYLNCDEGEGDADGFAPKLSVGDNNYFYGCRAWANSDDGWDVFYKKEGGFGDNMTIVIENCISYKNGFLDLQTIAPDGNGNGYKCGSNQGAMNVVLNRCLAIHNKAKGFDQNHNAGDIIMNNCTGMTLKSLCGEKAYSYRIYEDIASGHEVRLTNCIAINDNDATDKRDKNTGLPKDGENGKYGEYGRFEVDETLSGMTITTSEFQKAHPDFFVSIDDEELIAPRDEDGNLPEISFAHIKGEASHKMYDGSTVTSEDLLIDKGTKVEATTYRGIDINGIEYVGDAPDLGAYEYDGDTGTAIRLVSQESEGGSVRLFQAQNGILFVTVSGPEALGHYRAALCDAGGRILGQHLFTGKTTAIRLPKGANGMVVLKVEGDNGFKGVAKAIVK
ncbi:MAG: right-handed parallel beta-helix repeat-containing protein [Prevotella sp.]|nr:right-handed parallel beta-helix repeat-containing protein [Prevotella sp.]